MTDIEGKQLVETKQPIRRGFKVSSFWQQDERPKAKQSGMGFMWVVCMHLGQLCVFVDSKTLYSRRRWFDGVIIGGRTDLYIIRNGNLMPQRYANEFLRDPMSYLMLQPLVIPFF
ncbi:hypothetical protein TNCV_3768991 [Trichonephila clavipes]|nr:hypothetical protein TNCV_3768991 [Trichonephila clavipes]